MGHDPDREPPFFFQKNPDNLDPSGTFPYPPHSADVHHEAEIAVMLKSGGTDIPVGQALDHVFGYALSLDMTRRDLQGEQKKLGRPGKSAKPSSAPPQSDQFHPATEIGHLDQGAITLDVNGEVRQQGDINQMIWKIPEMITYLSEYFEVAGGDVILSGTPAGVDSVTPWRRHGSGC